MGAGFSGLVADYIGAPTPSNPGLGDIPESCVAVILTHLDPLEICKLARLNRVFREASSADFVWESKLPENYQILMKKLFSECPQNLTKKEIYARLCRPNRFDGGNKVILSPSSLLIPMLMMVGLFLYSSVFLRLGHSFGLCFLCFLSFGLCFPLFFFGVSFGLFFTLFIDYC